MTTEPVTTNGMEIRRIRKRSGIKLCVLAARAGISEGYLCNIEKGNRQGAPDTVLRIANALGVDIDAITRNSGQAAA